jgi:pyruvate/2-oxoglutarate dehydrogenase complex dihydrolipoamide acyltransferase (E2) component
LAWEAEELRLAKEAQAKRLMEQQWAREEAKKSRYPSGYRKAIGVTSQHSRKDGKQDDNHSGLTTTTKDPDVELMMDAEFSQVVDEQISESQNSSGVQADSTDSIAESTRLEAEAKNLEALEATVSAERSLAEQRAFEEVARKREQSEQARRISLESQTMRLEQRRMEDEERRRRDEATLASPLARVLAREYGLDLSCIVGTGRGGRVTADDVRNALPPEIALPITNPATEVNFYNYNGDNDNEDYNVVGENDINGKHNCVGLFCDS